MSHHGIVRKVEAYVKALKAGDDSERLETKRAVGELLRQSVLELPIDRLKEIENVVNLSIYECFVEGQQLPGLMLIDEMVDVDYMESALKITRFANYLRGALPTGDPRVASLVARTLGKVASIGAVLSTEVIEAELRRSVEWLAVIQSVNDLGHRRYSAIMVVTEILLKAPHTIATRAEAILAYISNGMRDVRKVVQIKCFEMLNLLLGLLADRSVRTRDNWYQCLFNDALELIEAHAPYIHSTEAGDGKDTPGIDSTPKAPVHAGGGTTEVHEAAYNGGLLILSALYLAKEARRHSGRSTLLLGKYNFAFSMLLDTLQKRRGNLNVIWCYVKVFESLCAYHPEAFCHLYLAKTVECFMELWGGAVSDTGHALLINREYRSYLLRILLCALETAKKCLTWDTGVAKSINAVVRSSGKALLGALAREVTRCGSDAFAKEQRGSLSAPRWGRPRSGSGDPKSSRRAPSEQKGADHPAGLSLNNNYNGGLSLLCVAGIVELAHATATATSPMREPSSEGTSVSSTPDSSPTASEMHMHPHHARVFEEREILDVMSLGLSNLGVTMEVCEAASRIGALSVGSNDAMYKKIILALRQALVGASLPEGQGMGPTAPTEQEIKHCLFMLANVAKMEPERVVVYRMVQCVSPYFAHTSTTLRLVAVKVMGDVLNSTHSPKGALAVAAGLQGQAGESHPLAAIPAATAEAVERLVQVAATDGCPEIRITALSVLPRQLDSLLCKESVYKLLLTISYDVSTDSSTHMVRLASLKVVSRLSSRQPALQPHIRKLLINALNELSLVREHSLEYRRSAELLRHVIASAPSLAQMYTAAIRDSLLPKAKTNSTGLTTEVMLTLEKLALVVGRGNTDVGEVVGVVLQAMEEGKPAAQRRVACLQCLAAWLRTLDWVDHPYERFPTLLPLLLRILQAPSQHSAAEDGIQYAVLQVLGAAGAYEPHRISMQLATRPAKTAKLANKVLYAETMGVTGRSTRRSRVRIDKAASSATRQIPNMVAGKARRDTGGAVSFDAVEDDLDMSPLVFQSVGGNQVESHLAVYHQNLAVRVMLRVILDRTLASVHHKMAVGALVMIVRRVNPTDYSLFLDPAYKALLALLSSLANSTSDAGPLVSFVIQQIRLLSEIVKDHARNYLSDIFATVCQLCAARRDIETEVLNQVLSLFNDFRRIYKECMTPHLRKIVPVLERAVRLTPGRTAQPVLKGLAAVGALGPLLDGYMTLLLPCVSTCFGNDVVFKLTGYTPSAKPAESPSTAGRGSCPSSLSLSLASTYPHHSATEARCVAVDTSILAESALPNPPVGSPDSVKPMPFPEADDPRLSPADERLLSSDSIPVGGAEPPTEGSFSQLGGGGSGGGATLSSPPHAPRAPAVPWEASSAMNAEPSLVYAPPSSGLMATGAATSGVVPPAGLLRPSSGDTSAGQGKWLGGVGGVGGPSFASSPPPEGPAYRPASPAPSPKHGGREEGGVGERHHSAVGQASGPNDLSEMSRVDCYRIAVMAIATIVSLSGQIDLRSFSVRILTALHKLLSADPTPREAQLAGVQHTSIASLLRPSGSSFGGVEDGTSSSANSNKLHKRRGSDQGGGVPRHGSLGGGGAGGGSGMIDPDLLLLSDARIPEERLLPQLEGEAVAALSVLLPRLKGSIPQTLVDSIAQLVARKNLETDAFRTATAQRPRQGCRGARQPQPNLSHSFLEQRVCADTDRARSEREGAESRDLTCNMRALSKALDVSSLSSVSDWAEWLRVLRIELVRESPNHAIRSCSNIAQVNLTVAKDLFNAAFVSCYLYLQAPHKGTLLGAISNAIVAPTIPSDLLQPLLSLAEFMEHMEVPQTIKVPPPRSMSAHAHAHSPAIQMGSCNFAASEALSSICQSASLALPGMHMMSPYRGMSLAASHGPQQLQGTPGELFMTTRDDVYRGTPPPQHSPARLSGVPRSARLGPRSATPRPLPAELDIEVLADKAERCRMYAKALHYREMLFETQLKQETGGFFGQYVDGYVVPFHPLANGASLEHMWRGWVRHVVRIVRLNQHLRNQHSAQGILEFALANFKRVRFVDCAYTPQVEASIYEELHKWERAKEEWLHILNEEHGLDLDAQIASDAVDASVSSQRGGVRCESPSLQPRDLQALVACTPPNRVAVRDTPSESPLSETSGRFTSLAAAALDSRQGGGDESWRSAVNSVHSREAAKVTKAQAAQGLVRALRNLGEWATVLQIAENVGMHPEVADETARAAWMMQDWDVMEQAVKVIEVNDVQTHVFKAALAIQQRRLRDANALILSARKLIQPDVAALASESYSRAYPLVVKLQVLSELEEVVQWHERGGLDAHEVGEREGLLAMWKSRLLSTERLSVYWEETLATRSLLVPPQQQLDCWLKYVSMARKGSKLSLARSTLRMLMNVGPQETLAEKVASVVPTNKGAPNPLLVSACCDYLWHTGERDHAPQLLHDYLESLVEATENSEHSRVKGKYYRKLGKWYQEMHADSFWLPPQRAVVIRLLRKACLYDPQSWKAWSKWAMMNHNVIALCTMDDARAIPFLLQAAEGLMHVIQLTQGCLQDLLRLLGLWFSHGHIGQVARGMRVIFNSISTNNWLQVIPQIVARMHHSNGTIRAQLHQLLVNLGKDHGQAVVYPLICVLCSKDPKRAQAGKDVLDRIALFNTSLVSEGRLVATSLAKVALILAEQWSCGIEEARWQCCSDNNVPAAIRTFQALHALMDAKAVSDHEKMFHQQFSDELSVAWALVQTAEKYLDCSLRNMEGSVLAFREKLNESLLIYSKVQKEIEARLAKMPQLDLKFANPNLSCAENLTVAVPGTYRPNEPVVTIKSFQTNCIIIPSKQRPRRIVINGSDGNEYAFLLKGREDLRQDERVMQLFSLINQLLTEDRTTAKDLSCIELYPVIPLASSAGLIGWLCQAETLYALVKDYRRAHSISITQEKSLIPSIVGNAPSAYDRLSLYQKVDVFEQVLESTKGDDLSRVLWLQSRSSEAWLSCRTTYTRSLAVMSMVGFLMGLGDRHPSNLMLDKHSRKVIHIDFGDCFEVASNRSRYPEKVPFRLTRMLIKAMDLAGVEGMFKKTSEDVLRVLRKNRSSMMSILSSFLHDPLINWRLVDQGKLRENTAAPEERLSLFPAEGAGLADDAHSPMEKHHRNTFFSEVGSAFASIAATNRATFTEAPKLRGPVACSMFSKRNISEEAAVRDNRDVVQRQAIDALHRISSKLDGRVFKMHSEEGLRGSGGSVPEPSLPIGDLMFDGDAHATPNDTYEATHNEGTCGECETAAATIRCAECGDVLCDACSSVVHSKRRSRGHRGLVRLPEQSATFLKERLSGYNLYAANPASAMPTELFMALTKRVISIQKVIRGFLARKALRSTTAAVAFEANPQVLEEDAPPAANEAPGAQTVRPEEQVSLLIREAIAHENLAVAYAGWCPWW